MFAVDDHIVQSATDFFTPTKLFIQSLIIPIFFSDRIKMNPAKLAALQSSVRIGGKGTARRKKKIVHKASNTDDKKLQSQLKKLQINPIPGIEEVNMFKDDGSVLHFSAPKVLFVF